MAVHAVLVVGHWKKNGLPLRSAGEVLKFKKTHISEALKDYAAKKNAFGYTPDSSTACQEALRKVRASLKVCADKSKGNKKLLDHLKKMQDAVAAEITELEGWIDRINIARIENEKAVEDGWNVWTKSKAYQDDWAYYLKMREGKDLVNVAKDVGKDKVGVVDKHAWVEAAKAGNVEELRKLAQQEMKSSQGLHQAILEYINQFKEAIKINL